MCKSSNFAARQWKEIYKRKGGQLDEVKAVTPAQIQNTGLPLVYGKACTNECIHANASVKHNQ